jgi:hypothetical protein
MKETSKSQFTIHNFTFFIFESIIFNYLTIILNFDLKGKMPVTKPRKRAEADEDMNRSTLIQAHKYEFINRNQVSYYIISLILYKKHV